VARIGSLRTVTRDRLIAAVALIAVAAVGATAIGNMRNAAPPTPTVAVFRQPPIAAEPAVAAAYRYPLGCLGEALSGVRPPVAGVDRHRGGPCWRYGVYLTVLLHRVGRVWRMALEAVSPSCPNVSVPPFVRAQVVVCKRPRRLRMT
jgi:hypothetical protein